MSSGGATQKVRVAGLSVGTAEDDSQTTGVTVLRFSSACPTVLDLRGGASATYDTGSLALEATFGARWAIFFAGGSVFGLEAGAGVREAILAAGLGRHPFRSGRRLAPVTGACLFDLGSTSRELPDYRALGRRAAETAAAAVPIGRHGAAAGAWVAKYRGRAGARPGGQGYAEGALPGLGRVGALVVLNSVGGVIDPSTGRWVAVARSSGRASPPDPFRRGRLPVRPTPRGTSLVAVVAETTLDRPALHRVAILAQTGLARCVVPSQTATDGDAVFAVSTGKLPRPRSRYPGEVADGLGALAAELTIRAGLAAVRG